MSVAFDTTYGIDAQAFKKQDVNHYSPAVAWYVRHPD